MDVTKHVPTAEGGLFNFKQLLNTKRLYHRVTVTERRVLSATVMEQWVVHTFDSVILTHNKVNSLQCAYAGGW